MNKYARNDVKFMATFPGYLITVIVWMWPARANASDKGNTEPTRTIQMDLNQLTSRRDMARLKSNGKMKSEPN